MKKCQLSIYEAQLNEQFEALNLVETNNDAEIEDSDSQSEIEESETGNQVFAITPLKKSAWYMISIHLQAHDVYEESEALTTAEMAAFDYEQAKQSLTLIQSKIKQVKNNHLPALTIKALKDKKGELLAQVNTTKAAYKKAKKASELVKEAANIRRYYRQRQVEQTYFSPKRTYKPKTRKLSFTIQNNRLSDSDVAVKTLTVDNQSTRRLITAEVAVMNSGLQLKGFGSTYDAHFGWTTGYQESGAGSYSTYEMTYCYSETVSLGGTIITYRQRNNPHVNHPGDYYMLDLGTYEQMYNFILTIINPEESEEIDYIVEKNLAQYMLRYTQTGKTMTLEELSEFSQELTQNDLKKLNRIFYHCFVKEPARFFLARDEEHQLPMASAQARALKLLVRGHITMADVFAQDAPYGVFTGKELGSDVNAVKEKIDRINDKYEHQIMNIAVNHADNYYAFMHHHPNANTLPTRQILHDELIDVYGGESDSDGEGYDTDDEFTL